MTPVTVVLANSVLLHNQTEDQNGKPWTVAEDWLEAARS